MTKTTILFDLDGTLSDPKESIFCSIRYAMHHLENAKRISPQTHSDDQLFAFIGPPIRDSFAHLLQTQDAALISEAVRLYREEYASRSLLKNQVYPNIPDLIQTLAHLQHHQLFVATTKPTVYAKKILQHFQLDSYFSGIYGSELDGTRSDKKDLLAYIQHHHPDINPSSTFMVGDRRFDMEAARHHQFQAVGVLWGYGSKDELQQAGSDQCVSTVDELRSLLVP